MVRTPAVRPRRLATLGLPPVGDIAVGAPLAVIGAVRVAARLVRDVRAEAVVAASRAVMPPDEVRRRVLPLGIHKRIIPLGPVVRCGERRLRDAAAPPADVRPGVLQLARGVAVTPPAPH